MLEGTDVAGADSIAWARLREQGMVLLGHTHTHEFAAGGTTDQVGNPWALDLIAGGSSGGSAAALAARMTPAALGSDTCGSLRIPSACCGTCTIKPTHGRIPLDGIVPLAPSLDHPGPMARTIADCAALLRGDGRRRPAVTPLMPPPAAIDGIAARGAAGRRPLEGVTIALTDRTHGLTIDARSAAASRRRRGVRAARSADRRAAGAVDVRWDDLSARADDRGVGVSPASTPTGQTSTARRSPSSSRPPRNFTDAQALPRRPGAPGRRAPRLWEEWFGHNGVDLVLEPTLPIVPYERGPGYERGHAGGAGDPLIALTALWDMTGMPVASLPVSWNVGVSLIAPRGHEAPLVQAAIDLQEHALGIPRRPAPATRP